jgi:phosphoketolase
MGKLLKLFSFPYDSTSHVAPKIPGSMHEVGDSDTLFISCLKRCVGRFGPNRCTRIVGEGEVKTG